MAAERETMDRLIAAHLASQIGARFKARIAGVTKVGLFVKLTDTGADGFIPAASLGADYFRFEEASRALVGTRTGETIPARRQRRSQIARGRAVRGRAALRNAHPRARGRGFPSRTRKGTPPMNETLHFVAARRAVEPRATSAPRSAAASRGRCPQLRRGQAVPRLSQGRATRAPVCGEDLSHQRADDAPAYLTMLVVGHFIVAGILAAEELWPDFADLLVACIWPASSRRCLRSGCCRASRARWSAINGRCACTASAARRKSSTDPAPFASDGPQSLLFRPAVGPFRRPALLPARRARATRTSAS